jgi:hypothetical protein
MGNWGREGLQGRTVERRWKRRPAASGTGGACAIDGGQRGKLKERERGGRKKIR